MFKKKAGFSETAEGIEVRAALVRMADDNRYNTTSSYSSNTELYPENSISFVEKHMTYLSTHPNIDPQYYISNLRIKTRMY